MSTQCSLTSFSLLEIIQFIERLITTLENVFVSLYNDPNVIPLSEKDWVEQRKAAILGNRAKY